MIQKSLRLIPTKILLEVGGSILFARIEVTKWTYSKIRWEEYLINLVGGINL